MRARLKDVDIRESKVLPHVSGATGKCHQAISQSITLTFMHPLLSRIGNSLVARLNENRLA